MPGVARVGRRAATVLGSVLLIAACGASGHRSTAVQTTGNGRPTQVVAAAAPASADTTTSTTGSDQSSTTASSDVPAPPSPSLDPGPAVGGGPAAPSLNDTGYTLVRVTIDSKASWVDLELAGTGIDASRVVSVGGGTGLTALGGRSISTGHPGIAVVDLVLSVPSGAAPSMQFCKSPDGPATVSVERRTDAPTAITSITNDGEDPSLAPGRCQNEIVQALDHDTLVGPVRWPARADARPLVLAGYYPWYDSSTLQHDFGDDPVGPADTTDPATVRRAVDLAASSGIDGFVAEYDSTPANDDRIDELYQAADDRGGFPVALQLDIDLMVRRSGLSTQLLDTALGAVAARAGHPSQLRIGDQPVVFVYGASWVDRTQWSAAMQRLYAATGVQPYVIADDPSIGAPGVFQYATNNLPSDQQLSVWGDATRQRLRDAPALAGGAPPLWVAPVSPGYDDRRLGRPTPTYVDRAGGRRYDSEWTAALDTLPDWVLITSWNEYYEQTHVMPGTTTGTQALQQTADWSARFHRAG